MKKKIEKNKSQIEMILALLQKAYPNAKCELIFRNPLQLLVATILSAQSTDRMVNVVTPLLFDKYTFAADFAEANDEQLRSIIKSIGVYNNKGKNIKAAAKMIVDDFNGDVPKTMADLIRLPGVGRKTANVVLFNGFGVNEGIAVDTHVARVANRIGLTEHKQPERIEKDLMDIFPVDEYGLLSHLLIAHGRKICKSQKPLCENCVLSKYCKFYQKKRNTI